MRRLLFIIILFITVIPTTFLFPKENRGVYHNDNVFSNKLIGVDNYDFLYDKHSIKRVHYTPLSLLEPFKNFRLNLKKDNMTLFFLPSSTDFFSKRTTTSGIKYNLHKGIEIYYLAYQKPGKPILYGIENNLGISFSKNIFK